MIPLRDNIPSRKFPIVNYALIGINLVVFFYQITLAQGRILDAFIFSYGVIPSIFFADPYNHLFPLISSQFIHGGWMHVLSNMLYLYIFGDNVEDRLGHVNYVMFYLLCGISAALVQAILNPTSAIPMIGASGAIAGVLGSYFLFYPRARILALIPLGIYSRIAEIPALFFLGFWFLIQMINGSATFYAASSHGMDIGGVAWWAHSGGFLAGLLFALIFRKA